MVLDTSEIITHPELGIANHKPKKLPKNLEWTLELRTAQ